MASASPVLRAAHRAHHSGGGDFARWGRRGGLRTLALYGHGWFILLAGRRWEKITASSWQSPSRTCAGGGPDMAAPLFSLGQLVATPGALALRDRKEQGSKPTEDMGLGFLVTFQ